MTASHRVWGIHAGKLPNADSIFLSSGLVAIGWEEMGDLTALDANLEAFKKKMSSAYPQAKPGGIPVSAGEVFRFVHDLKEGDLIVYPAKLERVVHIGEVSGPYRYDARVLPTYPNVRPVKWLRTVPRTSFSQGALYEIGAAMAFFQVKNYADEFIQAATGKVTEATPRLDDSVQIVATDVQQTTSDFILKTLDQDFKGHPLAEFVAELLKAMGWRTRVSPPGTDKGVDVVAYKDELDLQPPRVKIQVKSGSGSVGHPTVSQLYGTIGDDLAPKN